MTDITFVTGNPDKAKYLSDYLGISLNHQKLDTVEIQSLDLREVVRHKAEQAYASLGSPVLVEDVALEFTALGRLPGTFIRYYVDEVPFETICRSLDGMDRSATARCVYAYYDGAKMTFFEGSLAGRIAEHPAGDNGFGWDKLFIPTGYEITRAELDKNADRETYLQIKPLAAVRQFIETL